MESHQWYGVRETVPEFTYGTYIGNKFVRRKYDGHTRIIAAFIEKAEATEYADKVWSKKYSRHGGGYMQIHELEYRLDTLARFTIIPVDILPSIQVCPF